MSRVSETTSDFIKGISASPGIAIGDVVCISSEKAEVKPKSITNDDVDEHLDIFKDARKKLINELSDMLETLKTESFSIIETQKQIVLDAEIEKRITFEVSDSLVSVDFAVYKTFSGFIERLKESGSELFRQRIVDLENLRDRLIDIICNDENKVSIKENSIVIATEISPTELVQFYEQKIAGLVMEKGGVTSHASLIAQSLGIPCIVNAAKAISRAKPGKAILDGREGVLLFDPDKEKLKEYQHKLRKLQNTQKRLLKNLSEPSKTKSGSSFNVAANIEFESELELLKKYNASDIGLLRTEGLLMSGKTDSVYQQQFYESVLKSIPGTVTFRLFDVGGDKLKAKLPVEANPFLGWRGIRMLLEEKNLLRNQLQSLLLCAGKHPGRVKILVPMVSVEEEIIALKEIVSELQRKLTDDGYEIDENVQIGIMIEVPSAALNAAKLARQVDFMSVGTNDLTQYTLAVDRGNEKICALYQQKHPSIWKLIQATVTGAQECNIPVAVCGELAGDPLGACGLMGLGITDFSMIASSIPKVKEELISHSDEDFIELAQHFLSASNTSQVEQIFEDWRI